MYNICSDPPISCSEGFNDKVVHVTFRHKSALIKFPSIHHSTNLSYNTRSMVLSSFSDPLYLNAEADPRIRFWDNGSGSSYGSGSDLKLNKFQFFFFLKYIKKLVTMFFCCNFELIIKKKIIL